MRQFEDKTCKDLGYKLSTGEDPCYPGLLTLYRNKEEKDKFVNILQDHLKHYGKDKGMCLEEADLLNSCKCAVGSFAKNARDNNCSKVLSLEARKPHCTQNYDNLDFKYILREDPCYQ